MRLLGQFLDAAEVAKSAVTLPTNGCLTGAIRMDQVAEWVNERFITDSLDDLMPRLQRVGAFHAPFHALYASSTPLACLLLSSGYHLPCAIYGIISREHILMNEVPAMAIVVEAIYEDGVLKPAQPLPLSEHEKVEVTVRPGVTWADRTAGLLGWTGSPELADRFATDPALDFPPPPDEP